MNTIGCKGESDSTQSEPVLLEKKAMRLAMALSPISAQRRIARIVDEFGTEIAVATSFGPTSAVLLHMVSSIYPGVRVIHIRHGHETQGTLRFAQQCQKRFRFDLHIYEAPKMPIPEFGTSEFEEFCRVTKVEPMRQVLARENIKIWFAGLIHDETVERRRMALVRKRLNSIAVYPILDWCLQDAALYCKTHDLTFNHDYFDPCKGPEQKLECGLHSIAEHRMMHTERT